MTAWHPPRLDPAWWDNPDLRPALGSRDVAAIFAWLQRHGWSQTQIGAATCQSQGEVSEILAGRQVRAYDVLERIADSLEIPRGLMGLAYESKTDAARAEVVEFTMTERREFLAAVASVSVGAILENTRRWLPQSISGTAPVPEAITLSDVEQVRSTTAELRRLDQRYGGGAAVDAARGFYSWARGMVHSTADAATHRELKIALADFSSLIGWAFHDLGNQSAARRYLMNALVLARHADENSLIASILYRLGRVSMHEMQPVEALRMLQLGQIAAQDAGDPAEIARLHANEALVYAMLGKEGHVKDSLARAEFEMGRADRSHISPWTTLYFIPGDYLGHKALIYNALATHSVDTREIARFSASAADLAADALASSGPDRSIRSQLFDRIILATNQILSGEIDPGLTTAHSVVIDVQRIQSGRGVSRLSEIATAAATIAKKSSEARAVRKQIESVTNHRVRHLKE